MASKNDTLVERPDIDAILRRCEGLPPGPWMALTGNTCRIAVMSGNGRELVTVSLPWPEAEHLAAFIASAIDDIHALVAQVEKLETRRVVEGAQDVGRHGWGSAPSAKQAIDHADSPKGSRFWQHRYGTALWIETLAVVDGHTLSLNPLGDRGGDVEVDPNCDCRRCGGQWRPMTEYGELAPWPGDGDGDAG